MNTMKYLLVVLGVLIPSLSIAEPYMQIQGGAALPNSFSSFEGEYWSKGGFGVTDLDLNLGAAYGAKAGYWLSSLPYLGVELDYLRSQPGFSGQDYRLTNHHHKGSPSYAAYEPGMKIRIDAVALQLAVRFPGETWQPYLAAGPALLSGNYGGDGADWNLGASVEAGLRVVVWKGLFASASYRYHQAHMTYTQMTGPGGSINGFNTFYESQFALAGLGWNF